MQNQPASSRALIAVDFPPPDIPVSNTMRSGGANSLHLVADAARHGGLRDLAREPLLEVLGRMVPLQLEQVVPGGDLDDGDQVAARAHRHDEQRHLGVQHAVLLLLDTEPVVLDPVVPLDQLHHHLDLLAVPHRRHAEQVLDVDDADPADLHVVLDDLRAAPVDRAALPLLQVHDVVRDQAVAAGDQVEGQLALADAALPQDEDTHADHVDEHSVDRGAGGERLLQELLDVVDEGAGEVAGAQERNPRVGGLALDPVIHRQVLGHHQACDGELEEIADALERRVMPERRQVADLGVSEDLQAVLVDVLGEAAEREPGLLDARAHDAPVEAVLAGEQLEAEIEIPVLDELLDLDRVHRSASVTERAPALYST